MFETFSDRFLFGFATSGFRMTSLATLRTASHCFMTHLLGILPGLAFGSMSPLIRAQDLRGESPTAFPSNLVPVPCGANLYLN